MYAPARIDARICWTSRAIDPKMAAVELLDIRDAAERIASGIYVSPCPHSGALSEKTGSTIHCKLDYLQRTGSFKERGARNALLQLAPERRARGVIAASAGNHALGLAYHASLLDIPVTVVMPHYAPLTKVSNCQSLGARVVLFGDDIGQARLKADELAADEALTYINGFDDPAVIAGQGTMGLEILEQVPSVDAIVVPVGGAGLIAGIALAVKAQKPEIRVIGVEPENAASLGAAFEAGEPVHVTPTPTLADGLAVPKVGPNGFRVAREHVDRLVTVNERAIARAILHLVELEKSVVEGAGAVGLAACLDGLPELEGKRVVLPLCGGNIDTPILGRIIERGLAADYRLCRFDATISDRPGGLAKFSAALADEGASIRQINHDRAFAGAEIDQVAVNCIVETRDAEHIERLKQRLLDDGFAVHFYGWND